MEATSKHKCLILAAVLFAMAGSSLQAAGILRTSDRNSDDIFIKSHQVNVTITNGFARTEVDQIFSNKGTRDLEAVYSFPLPEAASLSELSLWINGKEVMGEVLEKKRARQVYQQETRKRVDPALAEKNGYRSFEVTVFPVVAQADTRVRLVYYQPIDISLNVGRYLYPLAEGGVDEDAQRFWSMDQAVKELFQFTCTIKSAFPIRDVRVPGLEKAATITEETPGSVYRVQVSSETGVKLDRDIVLYYRLQDDVPARIELIPYRAPQAKTGTFMAVITPAADLQPVKEGSDWTFVLDTSGSMRGINLNTLVDGVSECLGQMKEADRFRVVTYSNSARDITKGYQAATTENISKILDRLQTIRAGGKTELHAALRTAYRGLDTSRTTAVILVTDGIAELNSQQHGQFRTLLEESDIRLFAIVLGNSGNQPLMERLAKDSGGFILNISSVDDMVGRILQAKTHLTHQCLRRVQIGFTGAGVQDLTPSEIPNLYHGQQLILFGRYTEPGPVTLTLAGRLQGEKKEWTCRTTLPEVDTNNPEIERLWALSSIEDTMSIIRDEGETVAHRQRVIDLGIEYSLVTDYTSMLVIEEDAFQRYNIERKNQQRVSRERQAQQQRAKQPVKNYRVDHKQSQDKKDSTFKGRRSPGFGGGTGPVGPLFIGLLLWARRRKRNTPRQID